MTTLLQRGIWNYILTDLEGMRRELNKKKPSIKKLREYHKLLWSDSNHFTKTIHDEMDNEPRELNTHRI